VSRIDELVAELCPDGVPHLRLSEVARIRNGRDYKHLASGDVPVYGTGGVMTRVDSAAHQGPSVLIPRKGSLDKLYYVDEPFWTVDTIFYTEIDDTQLVPKFFYYFLATQHLEELNQAGGVPSLTQAVLNALRIPVPPLEVQREIVRILDLFTTLEAELEAELEARRRQYAHYRDSLLTFPEGGLRWVTLGDLGKVSMCKRVFKSDTTPQGDIPFFKIGTFGGTPDAYISRNLYEEYRNRYSFPKKGDVLISAAGTIGRAIPYDGKPAYFQDSNIVWIDNDESLVTNEFLRYWLRVVNWATDGGTIRRLYNDNIRRAKIPVPPLDEQARIVAILDKFDALVNDLSVGLPAELAARRKQYEYYRDRLLTFKEVAA
jgi:type I restriction enzyme S subunit